MMHRFALGLGLLFAGILVVILRASASPTGFQAAPARPAVLCGAASFARTDYAAGEGPNSLATGDFNGDGRLDLAVANNSPTGTVSILLGNGDGSFQIPTPFPVGDYATSLVVGDLRGVGKLDLLTTGYGIYPTPGGIWVSLGDGQGAFAPPTYLAAGSYPESLAVADFNRDGKLDVIAGHAWQDVTLLVGNGDGTFALPRDFAVPTAAQAVTVGDINKDGNLDLAAGGPYSVGVSVLLGNGDGTFASPRTFSTNEPPAGLTLADFNQDGNLDLAVSMPAGVAVMLGDGAGGFGSATTFPAGDRPCYLTANDFNGDGRLDLAVANITSADVSILLGNGDGTFAPATSFGVLSAPTALAVADFDGDTRPDVAVANSFINITGSYTVSVLLNDCIPTVLPTPTVPTETPAPPTAIPPSSTSTPAATMTACALTFSDVQPADYFYTPVQYLACRGVVSGYGDGSFRPYANTTRAQQVKIVVLGFGLTAPTPAPGAYTFADVPPGAPFLAVIETAAVRQLVSGYTCGGPGEPCDGQRRPYLRPNAAVTRGQLAKIVVAAAGWPLRSPGAPTFADVAAGSPFYAFVETATCYRIVSGYACGGPGEPCDGQRRPYYRPGTTATRGQMAKIVYGALTSPGACAGAAVPR